MNATQKKARRQRREEKRNAKKHEKLAHCLDFELMTDPITLSESALTCEHDVAWKRGVQTFMQSRLANCVKLSDQLRAGTYKKIPAHHFILHERGNTRFISAVNFRDRVVQHPYCEMFLIPVMLNGIIADNSASQKGKGPDVARERFAYHMTEAVRRYGMGAYVASFDFKSYFASIDNEIAMQQIIDQVRPLVTCEQERQNARRLVALGREFICEEKGLGLGNQTSQTMAIAYASSVDHAIREICQCGLSGRYMDDGYVFCRNKDEAALVLAVAEHYARKLKLRLHPRKTKVIPITHHLTFLKTIYSFAPDGTVMREVSSDTLRRYKRHYASIARRVANGSLPMDVLEASEGSFNGIAQRATWPERYIHAMRHHQEKVRTRLALPPLARAL